MPLPKISPRPWKQGDPFSAAHLNETVDAMRSMYPVTADGLEQTTAERGGTSISNRKRLIPVLRRVKIEAPDLPRPGIFKGRVFGKNMNSVKKPGAIEEVDLGDLEYGLPVFLWNLQDAGKNTHSVATPAYAMAVFFGEFDQGKPVGILLGLSSGLPTFQYVGMGWFTVANGQNAGAYPFAVKTV